MDALYDFEQNRDDPIKSNKQNEKGLFTQMMIHQCGLIMLILMKRNKILYFYFLKVYDKTEKKTLSKVSS